MSEMQNLQKELTDILDQTPGDPMSFYRFADFITNNWDRVEYSLDNERSKGTTSNAKCMS